MKPRPPEDEIISKWEREVRLAQKALHELHMNSPTPQYAGSWLSGELAKATISADRLVHGVAEARRAYNQDRKRGRGS